MIFTSSGLYCTKLTKIVKILNQEACYFKESEWFISWSHSICCQHKTNVFSLYFKIVAQQALRMIYVKSMAAETFHSEQLQIKMRVFYLQLFIILLGIVSNFVLLNRVEQAMVPMSLSKPDRIISSGFRNSRFLYLSLSLLYLPLLAHLVQLSQLFLSPGSRILIEAEVAF